MVSMGYEARPAPTVISHPMAKLAKKLSLMLAGKRALTVSQIPKQRPLQMTIPIQEMTNPLQSPTIPSVARVFLQTSKRPVNYLAPPFLAFLRSLVSLVLAQSKLQTNKSEQDPARPPEARFPRNQGRYPSLSLFLLNILLKWSLKAKFRAWVGKYLSTLVKFPFQRAPTPSSATILLPQFMIPVYLSVRAPFLSIWSWFWSLSLMTSMGEANVFETAAETPPIMKSIMKFWKLCSFLPDFSVLTATTTGLASATTGVETTTVESLDVIEMIYQGRMDQLIKHLMLKGAQQIIYNHKLGIILKQCEKCGNNTTYLCVYSDVLLIPIQPYSTL